MILEQNPKTQDILTRAGNKTGDLVSFDRVVNLTADGAAVEEGDESGAFRLVGQGGTLPADLVKELGIKAPKPAKGAKATDTPAPDPNAPAQPGLSVVQEPTADQVVNLGGTQPVPDAPAQQPAT